jgi:hypothetical protein
LCHLVALPGQPLDLGEIASSQTEPHQARKGSGDRLRVAGLARQREAALVQVTRTVRVSFPERLVPVLLELSRFFDESLWLTHGTTLPTRGA